MCGLIVFRLAAPRIMFVDEVATFSLFAAKINFAPTMNSHIVTTVYSLLCWRNGSSAIQYFLPFGLIRLSAFVSIELYLVACSGSSTTTNVSI